MVKNDEIIQKTCIFDYVSMQNILATLDMNEKINVNIFQRAYILYKLNKKYQCYTELERISNYIKNKNNILFVISEYNRLQLGDIINKYDLQTHMANDDIEKELQRINNSVKDIRIEYLINNYLTQCEQKIIKNKLSNDELLTYKNKLLKLSDSIDEKTINLSGNKYYHIDIYKNYVLNYIFIENNDLYKDIFYYSIKTMLKDIKNIKDDKEKDTILHNPFSFGEANEYELSYLDIYLMIEFLTPKQIKKIFDISDLNTILFNDKKTLFQAYRNLINSTLKLNLQNEYKYKEYVRKFFIIFSKLELTQFEFKSIITQYIKFLKKYNIYFNDADIYRYLMVFVIEQYNDVYRRKFIDISSLEQLLVCIYKKTIKHYNDNEFIIKNALSRVIRNLSNIIHELDNKYVLPLNNLVNIGEITYL